MKGFFQPVALIGYWHEEVLRSESRLIWDILAIRGINKSLSLDKSPFPCTSQQVN